MVHHHSVMLALLFAPQVSALGLQWLSASRVSAEQRAAGELELARATLNQRSAGLAKSVAPSCMYTAVHSCALWSRGS